jgi:hypothetical protein
MIFMDLIHDPIIVSLREHDCSMDGSINHSTHRELTLWPVWRFAATLLSNLKESKSEKGALARGDAL